VADRRTEMTRSALELSFDGLLLAEGYDSATPARVAQMAQVGRSTFYEHFAGRDDLLARRLAVVLRPLADAVSSPTVSAELERALDHFWNNRVMARALLACRARVVATRVLTTLIEEQISKEAGEGRPALPFALAAAHIAGGQLAILQEWLLGRRHCATKVLASALHASSVAAARAMTDLPDPRGN
jgi:AcrR family transcriptional regulator